MPRWSRRVVAAAAVSALAAAGCSPPATKARPTPTSSPGMSSPASAGLRQGTEGPGASTLQPGLRSGGATSKGVTDRSVTVAFHWNRDGCGSSVSQVLGGFGSRPQDAVEAYVDWVNAHATGATMNGLPINLHGRRIRPVFTATGGADPACAAVSRAGAITMTREQRAFAAVSSTLSGDEDAVAPLVAQNGTLHFGAAYQPESFYARHHPYLWAPYATGSVTVAHLAAYVRDRLAQGGPPGHTRYDGKRVFGLVHPDTATGRALAAELTAALAPVRIAERVGYRAEVASADAQATAAIARLRDADVNTVLMLTDPVAPVVLANVAQRQQWSPDYVVSSYGYLDTGRTAVNFDPAQWRHAFGVSDFGAALQASGTEAQGLDYYRAYVEARPGSTPPGDAALWWQTIAQLAWALTVAGPDLTPSTVAAGLTDKLVGTSATGARIDVLPGRHGLVDDFGLVRYDPAAVDPRDEPNLFGRRRGKFVFYEGADRRYRTGERL